MSDSISTQKSELRRRIRLRLQSMTAEERHTKSVRICRRLMALDAFKHASTVMMFMPLPEEVDVTPVALRCFQTGVTVCVPKVDWGRKDMMPVEVLRFDDSAMDLDEHGIRVPRDGGMVLPSMIDLVIIPGLAFDVRGNRLGRGRGYYDRFLGRTNPSAAKVAVGFDEQVVDDVPIDERDICVDVVITDRRATRTAKPSKK